MCTRPCSCSTGACRQAMSLQPVECIWTPERDNKPFLGDMTLRRGLISSFYSSADGVHVGRTSAIAVVSTLDLRSPPGKVRQASTREAWLFYFVLFFIFFLFILFHIRTPVTTKPSVQWAVACSSRVRLNNLLWRKVCLLFDLLVVDCETLLISFAFMCMFPDFDEAESAQWTSSLDRDRTNESVFPKNQEANQRSLPFLGIFDFFA